MKNVNERDGDLFYFRDQIIILFEGNGAVNQSDQLKKLQAQAAFY